MAFTVQRVKGCELKAQSSGTTQEARESASAVRREAALPDRRAELLISPAAAPKAEAPAPTVVDSIRRGFAWMHQAKLSAIRNIR